MNPAARVPLDRLLAEGSLERVPVDAEVCQHLLTQAGNHLRTAAGGAEGGDPEGAFQLAYDACRKTCLALALAAGRRPRRDLHRARAARLHHPGRAPDPGGNLTSCGGAVTRRRAGVPCPTVVAKFGCPAAHMRVRAVRTRYVQWAYGGFTCISHPPLIVPHA